MTEKLVLLLGFLFLFLLIVLVMSHRAPLLKKRCAWRF
jgi:hypothetical protein